MTEKAYALITRGKRLLVFREVEFPEAGIQVPGGTVRSGERLPDAVLREAREETGLASLTIRSYLGSRDADLSPAGGSGHLRRHFFHLELLAEASERWRHVEQDPSDGSAPIEFELFWVPFDGDLVTLLPPAGQLVWRVGDAFSNLSQES